MVVCIWVWDVYVVCECVLWYCVWVVVRVVCVVEDELVEFEVFVFLLIEFVFLVECFFVEFNYCLVWDVGGVCQVCEYVLFVYCYG